MDFLLKILKSGIIKFVFMEGSFAQCGRCTRNWEIIQKAIVTV
jgi:hypothetical protein